MEFKRIAFFRRDDVKRLVALNLTQEHLERFMSDLRQILVPS